MRGRLGSWGTQGGMRLLPLLAAVVLLIRLLLPVAHGVALGGHPDHLHPAPAHGMTGEETGHGDRQPPDGQGGPCHFCRLDGVALPPPPFVLTAPDRPATVQLPIPEDLGHAVPALHVLAQPRAPPRTA